MTLQGLDCSHWQQETPPLGATLAFVFARATYGTSVDDCFAMHAKNVHDAGKVFGAYHFGRNQQPEAQASAFLNTIGPVKLVALDLERDGTHPQMTPDQASRFIQLVQQTGRKVGLYHSESGFPHVGQDYNWVANWDETPKMTWAFHQYGVIRSVDRDRFYGTMTQLRHLAGLPTSWRWKLAPQPGSDAAKFIVFTVDEARRVILSTKTQTTGGSDQPCSAPVLFTYPGHASRKLVQLNGGPRNGEWVIARYAAEYP